MFTLLIIALELALLAGAFWFVFSKEPRPRRMKSTIWGTYSNCRSTETYLLVSRKHGVIVENKAEPANNVIPFPERPEPPTRISA